MVENFTQDYLSAILGLNVYRVKTISDVGFDDSTSFNQPENRAGASAGMTT